MEKTLLIEAGGFPLEEFKRGLEKDGVTVLLINGIENGLQVFREEQPGVVVIGMNGDVPGSDFFQGLKSIGNMGDIMLVLLHQGCSEGLARNPGVRRHVDLLVEMPVTPGQLNTRIREQKDRMPGSAQFRLSSTALAKVVQDSTDFVILTDDRLDEVLFLNSAAEEALVIDNVTPGTGDCKDLCIWELYPPEILERLKGAVDQELKEGLAWAGEATLLLRDGRSMPVSQQVYLHQGSQDDSRFVSLVIRDITELKKTQETLGEQESFFRLITENTSDLISLFDNQGRNVYSSLGYEKLLGFSSRELAGEGLFEHVHHEDRDRLKEILLATIGRGKEVVLQYRMISKKEKILHFEGTASPIHDSEARMEKLIFVSRDITERVLQQEERRFMELHHLHAQKMESIGQLAAGVAHEMNTPIQYFGDNLRFIRDSFADLFLVLRAYQNLSRYLEKKGFDPKRMQQVQGAWEESDAEFLFNEIPKAIEQSLQGVVNLTKIVGAMKEFSHPGTDDKIPIDFNEAIENTLIISRNEWKYLVNVELDLDAALPRVSCLPDDIRQMLLNLVINASHAIEDKGLAAEEKGTITLSTALIDQDEQPWVELRVSDTGIGIPKKLKSRIFEPFFTTKPVGKGTGQGLAIVHNVVIDKHFGQVQVESELNEGTTFVIRLPVNPPPNSENE